MISLRTIRQLGLLLLLQPHICAIVTSFVLRRIIILLHWYIITHRNGQLVSFTLNPGNKERKGEWRDKQKEDVQRQKIGIYFPKLYLKEGRRGEKVEGEEQKSHDKNSTQHHKKEEEEEERAATSVNVASLLPTLPFYYFISDFKFISKIIILAYNVIENKQEAKNVSENFKNNISDVNNVNDSLDKVSSATSQAQQNQKCIAAMSIDIKVNIQDFTINGLILLQRLCWNIMILPILFLEYILSRSDHNDHALTVITQDLGRQKKLNDNDGQPMEMHAAPTNKNKVKTKDKGKSTFQFQEKNPIAISVCGIHIALHMHQLSIEEALFYNSHHVDSIGSSSSKDSVLAEILENEDIGQQHEQQQQQDNLALSSMASEHNLKQSENLSSPSAPPMDDKVRVKLKPSKSNKDRTIFIRLAEIVIHKLLHQLTISKVTLESSLCLSMMGDYEKSDHSKSAAADQSMAGNEGETSKICSNSEMVCIGFSLNLDRFDLQTKKQESETTDNRTEYTENVIGQRNACLVEVEGKDDEDRGGCETLILATLMQRLRMALYWHVHCGNEDAKVSPLEASTLPTENIIDIHLAQWLMHTHLVFPFSAIRQGTQQEKYQQDAAMGRFISNVECQCLADDNGNSLLKDFELPLVKDCEQSITVILSLNQIETLGQCIIPVRNNIRRLMIPQSRLFDDGSVVSGAIKGRTKEIRDSPDHQISEMKWTYPSLFPRESSGQVGLCVWIKAGGIELTGGVAQTNRNGKVAMSGADLLFITHVAMAMNHTSIEIVNDQIIDRCEHVQRSKDSLVSKSELVRHLKGEARACLMLVNGCNNSTANDIFRLSALSVEASVGFIPNSIRGGKTHYILDREEITCSVGSLSISGYLELVDLTNYVKRILALKRMRKARRKEEKRKLPEPLPRLRTINFMIWHASVQAFGSKDGTLVRSSTSAMFPIIFRCIAKKIGVSASLYRASEGCLLAKLSAKAESTLFSVTCEIPPIEKIRENSEMSDFEDEEHAPVTLVMLLSDISASALCPQQKIESDVNVSSLKVLEYHNFLGIQQLGQLVTYEQPFEGSEILAHTYKMHAKLQSVSPLGECENIYANVELIAESPVILRWCFISQWNILSMLHKLKITENNIKIKRGGDASNRSPRKSAKKLLSLSIEAREQVRTVLYVGQDTMMDISCADLCVKVEDRSHSNKPDISIGARHCVVCVNNFDPAVAVVSGFSFRNVFCSGTDADSEKYKSNLQKSNDGNFGAFDCLEEDRHGQPMVEHIEVSADNIVVRIAPELQIGKAFDDLALTQKSLLEQTTREGYRTTISSRKPDRLMRISMCMRRIDVSILEEKDPNGHLSLLRGYFTEYVCAESDDYFTHRFRLSMRDFNAQVERTLPSGCNQRLLNELDGDPALRQYDQVKGGYVRATVRHVAVVVDPLTLAVPLIVVKRIRWKGHIMLAQLSDTTLNIIPGYHSYVPISVFPTESTTNEKLTAQVHRGVKVLSRGIPPKIFMHGSVQVEKSSVSFGFQVEEILPKLAKALDRCKPPSGDGLGGGRKTPPLGWWDSLRFFFHGKLRVSVERFSFRWLLDSVRHPKWSILLQSGGFHVTYRLAHIGVKVKTLVISLPREGHPLLSQYFETDLGEGSSFDQRHSVVLIPLLNFDAELDWIVSCPHEASSSEHHCVYMSFASEVPEESGHDKFYRFRSHGMKLKLKATVSGDSAFTNWVAVRIDILPWLTHKSKIHFGLHNEHKSESTLSPKLCVKSLTVDACMTELRAAVWYGPDETDGVCVIIPRAVLSKEQSLVDESRIGKSNTSLYIAGSQTVLLDIQSNKDIGISNSTEEHPRRRKHDEDEIAFDLSTINILDRMTGMLGARAEQHDEALQRTKACVDRARRIENFDDDDGREIFSLLQGWSKTISEKRYLVESGSIIVVDRPLGRLSNDWKDEDEGDHIIGNVVTDYRLIPSKNSAEPTARLSDAEVIQPAWCVLMSGMKLLWTVAIRDALVSLGNDLAATVGLMTLQIKLNRRLSTTTNAAKSSMSTDTMRAPNMEQSVTPPHVEDLRESRPLGILHPKPLASSDNREAADAGLVITSKTSESYSKRIAKMSRSTSETQERFEYSEKCPIIEFHLFNPQIQLYAEATGGGIILAMKGIYVAGFEFLKLYADYTDEQKHHNECSDDAEKVQPKILRRKQFRYTLDTVEAFAVSNTVDVDAGLQWLETVVETLEGTKANENQEFFSFLASLLSRDERTHLTERSENDLNFAAGESTISLSSFHHPKKFVPPVLLRKILNPFSFQTCQDMYRTPLDLAQDEIVEMFRTGSMIKIGGSHGEGSITDNVTVHLDELAFCLDSYQFSTTIDLVRNVILAPPPPPRPMLNLNVSSGVDGETPATREVPPTSDETPAACVNFSDDDDSSLSTSNHSVDVRTTQSGSPMRSEDASQLENYENEKLTAERLLEKSLGRWRASRKRKGIRNALRSSVQNLLSEVEDQGVNVRQIRHIDWTLCSASWKINIPDILDDVSIELTGIMGEHDFFSDGSMSTQLELEDLRVRSLRPGQDAMSFFDPTSVLATSLEGGFSPCLRCGQLFDRANNKASACQFHGDGLGQMVNFSRRCGRWSCCGATVANQPGCISRPHTGRERASIARIETLPLSVKGITVYRHLEVNIYPEVAHTIIVQMTGSVARMLKTYFVGEKERKETDQLGQGRTVSSLVGSADETINSTGRCDEGSSIGQKGSFVKDFSQKRQAFLGKSQKATSNPSVQSSPDKKSSFSHTSPTGRSTLRKQLSTSRRQSNASGDEVIFIQHWRVGHINTEISLSGFPIEPTGLEIKVPAFARAYKIGAGSYLTRKYISYLIHEVVKSAASSGMNKVRGRITGHGPEERRRAVSQDCFFEANRADDANAARRALILGNKFNDSQQQQNKFQRFLAKSKKKKKGENV